MSAIANGSVTGGAFKLPAIIGDNMVLQRSDRTPVWGKAAAGTKVAVAFHGVTAETTTDSGGAWRVDLNLTAAPATPAELTIRAGADAVTLRNVIVGEVWLCSGQSNMEWVVKNSNDPAAEAATADYPAIRHFKVQNTVAPVPQWDLDGRWVVATPETVAEFTAAGYFFAREIHRKTGHPIGLVNSSWGGTGAEAWTSDGQLRTDAHYDGSIALRDLAFNDPHTARAQYETDMAAWLAKNGLKDDRNEGLAKGWADPATDASDWKTMALPQAWQSAGLNHNGIVWFRKEVDLPADWAGKPVLLELGPVDDADVTYVNGTQVGQTYGWDVPRKYQLPAGLLRTGRNVIAVRVWDEGAAGGIVAGPLKLSTPGAEPIKLDGPWRYAVERAFVVDLSGRPMPPLAGNPNNPAVLYNGMIAPVIPYGIRGCLWYQGENNAGRYAKYRDLLGLMVGGWRKDWQRGDFPFYIVQLAAWQARSGQPEDTDWAKLRDAQTQAARTIPNSGLAVAIDVGDAVDIHPKNKQDVGKRLAAIALVKDYGQQGEYSGPVYARHDAKDGTVRVTFRHTTGGLTAKGGALKGFAVAGTDGKYHWATATIDDDAVVLESSDVPRPTAVRYAWGNNPEATLYNGAGFPAVPFSTDMGR